MKRLCRGAAVLLFGFALLAGCSEPASHQPPAKAGAPSASVPAPWSEADSALFDRLVTAESVFPDRAQRSLYRVLPAVTENGQRSYTFQLISQPTMDEARHFNLVTITWARHGQLVKSPAMAATPSGVGGPGGGFVDGFAQTNDRTYDVRVSQGMLLPNGVNVPAFDVEKAAAHMVRLYEAQRAAR